ncbi:hypothetical protein IFR05_012065 [Cadophora sp. M221]|nr:hypothetical protein IFR05_012065 [Cadophora sp. M221]
MDVVELRKLNFLIIEYYQSKCDSRLPQCSTCLAHKSHCHYDKPPSLAYVRSLEARIEQLVSERGESSSQAQMNVANNDDETVRISANSPQAHISPYQSRSISDHTELSSPTYQTQEEVPSENERDSDRWVSQISVDSHGGVSFHNPTSVFHEAPSPEARLDTLAHVSSRALSGTPGDTSAHQVDQIKHSLVSNAAHQKRLEDLAMGNITAIQSDVPANEAAEFLRFHWCWIHPMFMSVYRPAFTRDMALSSPDQPETQYFSRWEFFLPWLYSGMAFRIAIDLGIHLPSDKLRGYATSLTVEDIEIRKRLFWGCYTWDKAMSLYLGRMPAFVPPVESNPPDFMDDFTEHDLWEPFYGSDLNTTDSPRPPYPPQKGYMISCFTGLCKLSTILSTIMLEIYGSSSTDTLTPPNGITISPNAKSSSFIRISSSIQKWWNELPSPVRLDVHNLPPISPPLHIVSLNLLYQTTLILLHRPYIIGSTSFSNPAVLRSYEICITATAAIHDLLVLLTSTFGYGHTTYLNCYNTYVAATIAVLYFQLREEEDTVVLPDTGGVNPEKLGLKFFLEVLQRSAMAMPGLNRSVEIVKRHMQNILERRSRRYLESLFPISDSSRDVMIGNPYHQQPLVAPNSATRSMPTSDSTSSSAQYRQFPPGCETAQPQTNTNSNSNTTTNTNPSQIYQPPSYPSFNLEGGLPAFPGQDFNMGMDCTLDQEIIDPQTRAAILGLDPHLTLNHESSDWTYGGFYV